MDVESDSDDGSDMEDMDEYLPRVYDIEDENIPDDGYDVELMENDGTYETSHVRTYKDLKEELPAPTNLYDGVGPCLKRGIGEKFKRCIEAVAVCGGLDYNFFKRMAANSNQYAKMNLDSKRRFAGYAW